MKTMKSSWRKDPLIQEAKHVADSFAWDGAIIIGFPKIAPGETFVSASYGRDKAKCEALGRLLNRLRFE